MSKTAGNTAASAVEVLPRRFEYDSLTLDDIPGMDPEEIKEFYAAGIYPELTQAIIEGPTLKDGTVVYKFKKIAGQKGITVKDIAAGTMPSDVASPLEEEMTSFHDAIAGIMVNTGKGDVGDCLLPSSEHLGLI